MAFVITEACLTQKASDCLDVCPVDCIHEGEDQYYIDPDYCIDCGACAAECPVEAIYHEDELTKDQMIYVEKATNFFK